MTLVAVTAGSITLIGELESEIVSRDCANSEYDATLVAGNVLQRFEQLGGAELYLCSDLSGGVTGEIHFVDSGYNVIAMPQPDALKAAGADDNGGQ